MPRSDVGRAEHSALAHTANARVREEGRRTTCLSNIRQIGMALHMYHQDYEEFPVALQTLRSSGYIRTSELMQCLSDPFIQGWGRVAATQIQGGKPVEGTEEKISYLFGKHFLTPSCWQKVQNDPRGSLVICQMHGQRVSVFSSEMPKSYDQWEGRVMRLQTDGSVKNLNFIWKRNPPDNSQSVSYQVDPMVLFGNGYETPTCSAP